jgi:Na+-driven multidrug efflux pump
MAAGGAVIAGQYLGAQRQKEACSSAQQLVWLMFLTGLGMCLFLLLFHRPIMDHVFGAGACSVLKVRPEGAIRVDL